MATYVRLKELKDKENDRIIAVLRYIGMHERCMSCGNIEFRKLYSQCIKDEVLRVARSMFPGRSVRVSYRQYKYLRKYTGGKVSINTAVYLLALYNIMIRYLGKPEFYPQDDYVTYTQYVVELLTIVLDIIVHNGPGVIVDQEDYDMCVQIQRDLAYIDNIIGMGCIKIYNNIW